MVSNFLAALKISLMLMWINVSGANPLAIMGSVSDGISRGSGTTVVNSAPHCNLL